MSRSEIIGSWHNTGFYGHPRSRPRNDFVVEYRHLAKPQPPHIFIKRAQLPSSAHIFSKHDNRHSFLNDALYFEEGLGRKRIENSTNRHQPNLLSWMTAAGKDSTAKDSPLSCYMVDYRGVSVDASRLNRRVTSRVKTGNRDAVPTTAYRYTYSADNPHLDEVLHPSKDVLTINRIQKPVSRFSRESVASCLSWYIAPTPPPSDLHPQKIWSPDATRTDEPMMNTHSIIKDAAVTTGLSSVEKLPPVTMTAQSSAPEIACSPTKIMVL